MKKKVVIIGGGPAGLSCAYYLLKNSSNYEVTVLEKDKQVGGISKTIEFNGYKIDTGIHRFFTKNDEVMNLWKDILTVQNKPSYEDKLLNKNRKYDKYGSDPEKEDKSFLIKDRYTRIYYDKKFYDYPISINYKTLKNMGFITIFKAGFSYLKSVFIKKEEKSLEDFYINRFGKVLYNMFFESYTEKVWGIHPNKISPSWGAQRVKGLSIKEIIKDYIFKVLKIKNNKNTETSLIETFYYPKLGCGQMYEEMASKIKSMGGNVILLSNVKKIEINDNKITKVIYEKGNIEHEINCDICVSSMPIKDLINSFNIDVSKDILNISSNLPYRNFMSVGLVVDKFNLKNNTKIKTINNIIPDSWIYVQDPSVKMGRIQIFNNWSSYLFKNKIDISNKVLIGLEYFSSDDDKYYNMSDEEFIKFAISEGEKLNFIKPEFVEQSIRIKIPKAYPAYFGVYDKIDKVVDYLNSFSNLYCIGRNGQHRYNNMDHSILTGIETAKCVIKNKSDKSDIWKVNTEKEYHEKN